MLLSVGVPRCKKLHLGICYNIFLAKSAEYLRLVFSRVALHFFAMFLFTKCPFSLNITALGFFPSNQYTARQQLGKETELSEPKKPDGDNLPVNSLHH